MNLNDYVEEVLKTNREVSIEVGKEVTWQKLALVHTEKAEATSAYREGKHRFDKDTFESELMDALSRIIEILGIWECDAEEIFKISKERNKNRKGEFE